MFWSEWSSLSTWLLYFGCLVTEAIRLQNNLLLIPCLIYQRGSHFRPLLYKEILYYSNFYISYCFLYTVASMLVQTVVKKANSLV